MKWEEPYMLDLKDITFSNSLGQVTKKCINKKKPKVTGTFLESKNTQASSCGGVVTLCAAKSFRAYDISSHKGVDSTTYTLYTHTLYESGGKKLTTKVLALK